MAFEITACRIEAVHQHPKFDDRTEARVQVTLRETSDATAFDHDLTLRVWAHTNELMSTAEINHALLARAATILKRTISVASQPRPVKQPEPLEFEDSYA